MAGHPSYTADEIGNRGEEIYEQRLRAVVETPENIGRMISIDIETGDFEVGGEGNEAARRLRARRPGATVYGKRIGYDYVYELGGASLGARKR